MPYFLVSHTSLVEGEDEVKAAEAVLTKLRSDDIVEFSVKFDELTVKTVAVARADILQEPARGTTESQLIMGQFDKVTDQAFTHPEAGPRLKEDRISSKTIVAGAALFVAGLLLGPFVVLLD
jgi:hypothetical protein